MSFDERIADQINALLKGKEKESVWSLHSLFRRLISEGKGEELPVLLPLENITSLNLSPSSASEPFGSIRTAKKMLSGETNEAREALEGLSNHLLHPDLKARICDILWLVIRSPEMARSSIRNYLEAAEALFDPDQSVDNAHRLERALSLSLLLNDRDLSNKVVDQIEKSIIELNGEDPLWLSNRLMELLIKKGMGNEERLMPIAQNGVNNAEQSSDWRKVRNYLRNLHSFQRREGDEDTLKRTVLSIAESYLNEAKDQHPMIASNSYEKAIEAYRRIGGQQEKVKEINLLLREAQKETMKHMQSFSTPSVDLSEKMIRSREHVSGKEKKDAVRLLALITHPENEKKAKEHAKKLRKQFFLQNFFGQIQVDNEGRVVTRTKPDDNEEIIANDMLQVLHLNAELTAFGIINPARLQVLFEHNFSIDDFIEIVSNHQLVPQGHEHTYAKGLYAGLTGDFLVASHLLIPQLENSLRYVLGQHGVEPSSYTKHQVQKMMMLPEILRHDLIQKLFGKDMVFCLKGILLDKAGSRFRDRLSHGQASDNDVSSCIAIYLWWLILQLIILPLGIHEERQQDMKKEEQ